MALGAVVAVVLAPLLNLIGFKSTGIAAGSIAAWLMKVTAIFSGGGVAAGSWVALWQSIGATVVAGAGTAVVAATATGAAIIGAAVGLLTIVFG